MRRFFLKAAFGLSLIGFCLSGLSCNLDYSGKAMADNIFSLLKDNEAKIILRVDGKEFYPPQSIFKGKVEIVNDLFSMTLEDQFDGKTIVNLGGDKWYQQQPIEKEIFANNTVGASIRIGRIKNKLKMIGEGYVMYSGRITALDFTSKKMVFLLNGRAGKYSDFQEPDKFMNIEGLIVYKMPVIRLRDITEKEVFHSSDKM